MELGRPSTVTLGRRSRERSSRGPRLTRRKLAGFSAGWMIAPADCTWPGSRRKSRRLPDEARERAPRGGRGGLASGRQRAVRTRRHRRMMDQYCGARISGPLARRSSSCARW